MKRTTIQPKDVFVPKGKTYSHGVIVEAAKTLYVAGQTSRDVEGNIVFKGDPAGQTRQVLDNIAAIVDSVGGAMGSVVKTTVYLKSLLDFEMMNEAYAEYFPFRPPARATVEVSGLPKGALVEIEAVAVLTGAEEVGM